MNNDELIMVDIFDNPIGKISKQKAHENPILHRAFSVFLYDKNKMLIQQRALEKYHSGGLWANTCCSHPRSNDLLTDAKNRLFEEVGIKTNNLKELFSFSYLSKYADNLFEYEFDHVIVGKYSGDYKINKNEVADLKWIDIDELAKDMATNPQKYATWFLIACPKVIEFIRQQNK